MARAKELSITQDADGWLAFLPNLFFIFFLTQ